MKYFSLILILAITWTLSSAQVCYTAIQIPYSPSPFAGTAVVLSDDAVSPALPIGFTFCYFGNLYTNFYIGSNGWIGFTSGQAVTFTTVGIPSTSASVPKNCIMGPWQDWHPGILGGPYIFYQTLGAAPNRRLVVSYLNIPMFLCSSTLGTFQIIIYESTDIIEHHIQVKPNCLTWANGTAVQGLHDLSGTLALTIPGRNSTQWTTSDESYRYTPSCTNCGAMPLPVELLSFSATKIFNKVELTWTTATEINNDYFILEKSADAEVFSAVAQIKGAGTTNQTNNYSYTDEYPFNGISYYRLKQMDFDGKFEYSNIISVKTDRSGTFEISPVPVIDVMTIDFYSANSEFMQLEIINNYGNIIYNKKLIAIKGNNKSEIDMSFLSTGIYIVKIFNENGEYQTKIISKL